MEQRQTIEKLKEAAEILKLKIAGHKGLNVYAKQKALFEQWLQVELFCIFFKEEDIRIEHRKPFEIEGIPHEIWIDLTFKNWVIELKVFNQESIGPAKVLERLKNIDSDKDSNKALMFVIHGIEADANNNISGPKGDWTDKFNNLYLKYLNFEFENKENKGVIGYALL